jgi:hypothetical protein
MHLLVLNLRAGTDLGLNSRFDPDLRLVPWVSVIVTQVASLLSQLACVF